VKNCKECKNFVADKELYIGKCKATDSAESAGTVGTPINMEK
jgi:hypothetical protein